MIHRNGFLPVHVLVSILTFLSETRRATFRSWFAQMLMRCKGTTFSLMERNSLAENRVSLSIFNYHTWIEYDCKGTTFSLMERNSLAENRVSLSIFNYHTWIEYDFLQ